MLQSRYLRQMVCFNYFRLLCKGRKCSNPDICARWFVFNSVFLQNPVVFFFLFPVGSLPLPSGRQGPASGPLLCRKHKCYRPLNRMASNNLALGAAALLKAGADPKAIAGTEEEEGGGGKGGGGGRGGGRKGKGGGGETPMAVARSAGAWEVVQLLLPYYTSSSSSSSS